MEGNNNQTNNIYAFTKDGDGDFFINVAVNGFIDLKLKMYISFSDSEKTSTHYSTASVVSVSWSFEVY